MAAKKRSIKKSPRPESTPPLAVATAPAPDPQVASPQAAEAPPAPASPQSTPPQPWTPSFWQRLLLVVCGGCAIFLAFPTYDLWPLAYVALVPLLFAVHGVSAKQAFAWGALSGAITNVGGFYWISNLLQDFGHMSTWLAWILCVLMCSVQGLVFALWLAAVRYVGARLPQWPTWCTALPALIVFEYLFPMLFPWYLGNSQYLFYPAIQIADILGVLGITALVAMVNLVIYESLRFVTTPDRGPLSFPRRFVLIGTALCIATLLYGVIRIGHFDRLAAEADTLHIGMVEADIGIWEKEDPRKLDNNLHIHHNLSMELAERGVDLIIWPESSYQSPYIWGSTASTSDLVFLEADALFVPAFRDAILPAMRLLHTAFGRPIHHLAPMQRPFHLAVARTALARGFEQLPNAFPAVCGDPHKTHLRCPFRRVPPDDIRFFLPGHEDLVPNRMSDLQRGTLLFNQLAVQRAFKTPLLFGSITIRAPEGIDMPYQELVRAPRSQRELFNVSLLLDADGRVLGNYKKVYLLLFGEYIPFAESFPWIYDVLPEAGSFNAGTEVSVMDFQGVRLGMMICYEDILPAFNRRPARAANHRQRHQRRLVWQDQRALPPPGPGDHPRRRSARVAAALHQHRGLGLHRSQRPLGRADPHRGCGDPRSPRPHPLRHPHPLYPSG